MPGKRVTCRSQCRQGDIQTLALCYQVSAIVGCALLLFIFFAFSPQHLFRKIDAACREVLGRKVGQLNCLVYVRNECALYCPKLRESKPFYLHIPLILLGIYTGAILEIYRFPSSFLCLATSLPHIKVTCSPLLTAPHTLTFALLLPSSSYLQKPQISLSQNGGTVWIKLKEINFSVSQQLQGEKKSVPSL